ncbi:MAG: hypothetical protein OHK0017_13310 [Patescibacteria group bacterium]
MLDLNKLIIDNYALGNIIDLEIIQEGAVGNNNILRTANAQYFVKVIPGTIQHEERVKQIFNVYNFVYNLMSEVEMPLTNIHGGDYVFTELGFIVVFPYVTGIKYSQLSPDLKQKAVQSSAKTLAKFHSSTAQSVTPIVEPSNTDKKINTFIQDVAELRQNLQTKQKLSEIDEVILDLLNTKEICFKKFLTMFPDLVYPTSQLVHGDFHAENLLFNEVGEVIRIFDWDNTAMSSHAWELIYAMLKICFDDNFENYDPDLVRIFIQSYHNINPINKQKLTEGWKIWYIRDVINIWASKRRAKFEDYRVDKFILNGKQKLEYVNKHLFDLIAETQSFLMN